MKKYGGHYIDDMIYSDMETYGIVVADQQYEFKDVWSKSYTDIQSSVEDGYLNTIMMNANNDSPIAKRVLSLNINGFNDWYIPSLEEMEKIRSLGKDKINELYFYVGWYWSSTQSRFNDLNAHCINFRNFEFKIPFNKTHKLCVRPIRKFKI